MNYENEYIKYNNQCLVVGGCVRNCLTNLQNTILHMQLTAARRVRDNKTDDQLSRADLLSSPGFV